MTMLTHGSYIKLMIEWKYPVYPDSILNKPRVNGNVTINRSMCLLRLRCRTVTSFLGPSLLTIHVMQARSQTLKKTEAKLEWIL
jgi:hypothetical protein